MAYDPTRGLSEDQLKMYGWKKPTNVAGTRGDQAEKSWQDYIANRQQAISTMRQRARAAQDVPGALAQRMQAGMSDFDRKTAQGIAAARSQFASGGGGRLGGVADVARNAALDKGLFGGEMAGRIADAKVEGLSAQVEADKLAAESQDAFTLSRANRAKAYSEIKQYLESSGDYGAAANLGREVLANYAGQMSAEDYAELERYVNGLRARS